MTERPMYYGMDGQPLSFEEFIELFKDPNNRRVAEDTLADGTWVSTVLLSCDHSFGDGPPIIFESMAFAPPMKEGGPSGDEMDCERYSTLEEAKAGHEAMVAKLGGRKP